MRCVWFKLTEIDLGMTGERSNNHINGQGRQV
jgi:hypothetical protein